MPKTSPFELLDAGHFMRRIGTDREQKHDRRFAGRLISGQINILYRAAREAEDYEWMEQLDKELRWLECL